MKKHRFIRCDWRAEHGADDRPTGDRCGAPATHRIVLEPGASPHRIEKLSVPA